MKFKKFTALIVLLFCLCLTACGDAKRPIDYPDSTWTCASENIAFSVSEDGKITNATILDKNGEIVPISLVFTDINEGKVSITNTDETETYISGTCTYGSDIFSIFVTDIYNPDLNISSTRLAFERS